MCGALAGLAGAVQATGFTTSWSPPSPGYGFLGILVVLLAGFRTVWIGPLALVFVAVAAGGTQLQLRLDVDSSLSGVVLGVGVLVALLLEHAAPRKRRRWSRNPDMEAAFASIIAAATPLVFAAVGETITERSGVVNLGVEGALMLSAMTGFAAAVTTGSTLLGFVAAALVSMAVAGVVAFAGVRLGVSQIAVGFVLTILAIDLSDYLGAFVGVAGPGVPSLSIPVLSEIPVLGPVLFSQNIVVYASYLLIIGAALFLYSTRSGLALRGVGERPERPSPAGYR